MKKLLYILLGLPVMAVAQTTTQNYVKTSVYREATTTTDASKTQASVTYVDGLGRPIQQVAGKASATGTDIVTHIEYDRYNRTQREYLPYPVSTNNLSFADGAKAGTFGYYATSAEVEHTANPYSRTLYEASPLNRVLKTAAPGDPWAMDTIANNDHTIKYAYQTNIVNDIVKRLRAVATWELATGKYEVSTFIIDGNYPAGQLYKTITQDENKTTNIYIGTSTASKSNTVEEYKNKQGQLILKRTFNVKRDVNGNIINEILDTYYIYDQFGNLTFVIPPAGSVSTSATNLDNYCYRYKYDSRNRLIEKKLPGKQWEYIVYDSQDRVVATGPALSPFGSPGSTPEQGWLITRYDAFGRVAYTGWKSTGTTAFSSAVRKTMKDATVALAVKSTSANTIDGISVNYSDALPAGTKLLTVNYYDNYVFPGAATPSRQIEGQDLLTNCKGLPTGSWVRALTSTNETFGEVTYTFYDRKARPVRSHTANYMGGYTQTDTKMDFDGTPQYTITRHKRITASTEIITREDFTYTAQDRLLSHTHKINSLAPELMSKNEYTELGQLKNKKVGGSDLTSAAYHQKVDYRYNVRGWLTDINDIDVPPNSTENDLFAFRISYNTISDPVSTVEPLYNGNIAETYWRSSGDNNIRKYSYTYDKLNRMTGSYYQKPQDAVQLNNSYNEMLSYDKNGNILTLNRNGGLDDPDFVVEIDDLAYTYNGNQLLKVVDNSLSPQGFKDSSTNTADDLSYDAYGNMKTDNNKGITAITYNHLNLPVEIQFGGTTKKINYLYNAAGVKLKKTVTENAKAMEVDYLGGFQYKGGALQFFPTAEGYVDVTTSLLEGTVYNYVYQYKDHLGNVRMDFAFVPGRGTFDPGEVVIKEENHYYPFGLKHMNYNMGYMEYQELGGDVVLAPPPVVPTGKLPNNYKYNGKELQDELGLNMYDYGARNYDPAIGRWMNIDPLAEKFFDKSPYVYCANNPVVFIDPDGMAYDVFGSEIGSDGVIGALHESAATQRAEGDGDGDSTEVKKTGDGKYEVVGAKNDGDNNIYVVGADGKRTGATIGTTMQPTDFMLTNDKTGEFSGHAKATIDLNNLTVSGSVMPNEQTTASITGADAQGLLNWGQELFRNEVTRQSPSTFYGELEILKDMSANGSALDFKVSLGLGKYTPIRAGNTSDGKPIITTLRAVGNITFGANMRSTKPYLLGSARWYYSKVMREVGAYNQKQNKGNGYNSGFPYFGEHTYSGSYIHYGYFGKF